MNMIYRNRTTASTGRTDIPNITGIRGDTTITIVTIKEGVMDSSIKGDLGAEGLFMGVEVGVVASVMATDINKISSELSSNMLLLSLTFGVGNKIIKNKIINSNKSSFF